MEGGGRERQGGLSKRKEERGEQGGQEAEIRDKSEEMTEGPRSMSSETKHTNKCKERNKK